MKEHTSAIIRFNHRQKNNMKLVQSNKYKRNCFRIKCYCSVINNKKNENVFTFKHSTLFVIIVIIVMFGCLCVAESKDTMTNKETSSGESKCLQCYRNESRTIAIWGIQTKILKALGYENGPPKGIEKDKINHIASSLSRYMEKYYETTTEHAPHRHQFSNELDEQQPSVLLQEEYTHGDICSHCPPYLGVHKPIIFKFGNSTVNSEYKNVELMLLVNASKNCAEKINVSVYQLTYWSNGTQSYNLVKNNTGETYMLHSNTYISISVRDEVENHKLSEGFTDNITFVPVVTYVKGRKSHCPDFGGDNAFEPYLKFHYDDKVKKRSKRTPVKNDCSENSNHTECCRYPLTVDFDEMQWDFIITPRKYEAYLCDGECPLLYKQDQPHTHLLQQMKTKARAGPCCSPKHMNSINMLYITPRGTILYGKVPGMVVEKCGCS
ncbi:growth/differentiation factor 8 [Planococcus citri]|uniref:growth/differentiation factor 8 n=1 Tax=Planococcus citri TaxID=170843 RepID=UPI0031F7D2C9